LISATGDFPSAYQFLLLLSIAEINGVKKGTFPRLPIRASQQGAWRGCREQARRRCVCCQKPFLAEGIL
jgi:hypothetical protein